MWRKTRNVDTPTVCAGVDPNRNWDANWSGPGASNNPCTQTYYGTSVFSESECKAAADALVDIVPQAYADVHAYSQYWMFPYGYKSGKCESYDKLMAMSKEIVDAIQAVHRTRFVYGPINEVIYVASGSSADYAYDTVGTVCSYAPELRDQVFLAKLQKYSFKTRADMASFCRQSKSSQLLRKCGPVSLKWVITSLLVAVTPSRLK